MKWMYVDAVVDDWGLTASEFRVYGHLIRRSNSEGESYPSAESIAGACRLHRDTVFESLSHLEEMGLISREPRKGTSTKYKVQPPETWKARPADTSPQTGRVAPLQTSRPLKPVVPSFPMGDVPSFPMGDVPSFPMLSVSPEVDPPKYEQNEATGTTPWVDRPELPDIGKAKHELSQITHHALLAWELTNQLPQPGISPSKSLSQGMRYLMMITQGSFVEDFPLDPGWCDKNKIEKLPYEKRTYVEMHELIDTIARRMKADGFEGNPKSLDQFLYNPHMKTSTFIRYLNRPDAPVLPPPVTQKAGTRSAPRTDPPKRRSQAAPPPEMMQAGPTSWWTTATSEEFDELERKDIAVKVLEAAYNKAKAANHAPHPKLFWERAEALGRWHEEHLPQLLTINIHHKDRDGWETSHPGSGPAPWGQLGEFNRLAKRLYSWAESLVAWMDETRNGAWLPRVGSSEWEAFGRWMASNRVQLVPEVRSPEPVVKPAHAAAALKTEFQSKLEDSMQTYKKEKDAGRQRALALCDVWNTLQGGAVGDMALEEIRKMAGEDSPGGWLAQTFLETHGMVDPK